MDVWNALVLVPDAERQFKVLENIALRASGEVGTYGSIKRCNKISRFRH